MTIPEFTCKVVDLRDTLQTFTRRFTCNHDESEDLVQDTLLKALSYKDKFRNDANLKGWLFTIMRNTFINNYRRKQYIRAAPNDISELHSLNIAETHTFHSPDANFEYEDVWRNIHEMREDLLIPFKMHTSGYKYHEIAEHLAIPIGTVKNRIFQARKEIQKKLAYY